MRLRGGPISPDESSRSPGVQRPPPTTWDLCTWRKANFAKRRVNSASPLRSVRNWRRRRGTRATRASEPLNSNTQGVTNMPASMQEPSITVAHPIAPSALEDAGLTLDLTVQLVLKTLHFAGELAGTELASRLGLYFPIIEPAIDFVTRQRQCEIVGGSMTGRASYRYRITDSGRARATLFLENNHYVGVAPVPVAHYRKYMADFARANTDKVTRGRIREAFSHLVISDGVLDQLGPAINARHSMFVYGPPGNGKTVISQAIRNVLDGHMAIPYALEVEGSIIRVFDPVIH